MRIIYRLQDLWFNIKERYLKIFRGYSNIEIWNLDYYHSKRMVILLTKFKERTYSYPIELDSGKDWAEIIQQMIDGFQANMDKDGINVDIKEHKRLNKIELKGLKLFIKHYNSLWI